MSSAARPHVISEASQTVPLEAPIELGRRVIQCEATALQNLAKRLDESFTAAVRLLETCRGSVIVSGMGKAGLVGQKIAATLASTGTRSHFLHPAEAIHGDLGRIHADDVMVLMSHSGETEEVLRLLPSLSDFGVPIVAITGQPRSRLALSAQVVLWIGDVEEAGSLQLAPSTSTTAMLSLGDALALATSQRRGFTPSDFARFHPGGALGRRLARVKDLMRPLAECRVARQDQTVRNVLVSLGRPGRRSGAVLLIDDQGRLNGIFTDSDLARLLEQQHDERLDQPIQGVMTCSPVWIDERAMMAEAVRILTERRISELPVTDSRQRPIGVIDITDVVAYLPNGVDVDNLHERPVAESAAAGATIASDRQSLPDASPVILPLKNPRAPGHVDET